MRPRPRPTPPVLAALVALTGLLALASCRRDEDEFYARLYTCNPAAANSGCGTDRDGQPMACVAAHQLGGTNVCASSCDVKTAPPDGDETAICLPAGPPEAGRLSGARLEKCDPRAGSAACSHAEMSCVRTDLLKDEGVCMTVTGCTDDRDCRDPVRAGCMGQLLRDNYAAGAQLKTDHSYCVQLGCNATGAACSPGESCLRKLLPRESRPADMCVPNCDSNRNCPPNYFCYPDLYSRISPAICIPGLIGLRCRTRMDCLIGDCVDTGAGFNVCTVGCNDDADCARYDSEQGALFCNDKKVCAGPRAFRAGALCHSDADCRTAGETCARLSPDMRTGLCLFPCAADGSCTAFGGVAHACLPQRANPSGPPICFPGTLDIPCRSDGDCVKGLKCKETVPGQPRICSAVCRTDEDCRENAFAREGFCEERLSLCRSLLKDEAPCERPSQCESQSCIADPAQPGKKKCDRTPGY